MTNSTSDCAAPSTPNEGPTPVTRRHALMTGAAALSMLSLSRTALAQGGGADAAPTLFVEAGGRKLAYRSVGKGKPIVLAHRSAGCSTCGIRPSSTPWRRRDFRS